MKIKSIQPLFQFGIKAYKDEEVVVDDKLGKRLVKLGFAEALEKPKKKEK